MIACVSIYNENYKELAAKTLLENRLQYCLRHKYSSTFREVYSGSTSITECVKNLGFQKIEMVLLHLKYFEYVWLSDCDAMVMNMPVKLETIIESYPSDIILGSDFNGPNCGSMLIKNTEQVKNYLTSMLENQQGYCHEQDFIWKNPRPFIQALPQSVMNSYNYELYLGQEHRIEGNFKLGDFFLHWPAQSIRKRLDLYEKWKGQVID